MVHRRDDAGPYGGERSMWLHQPCLLEVPMVRRNQYGNITPAFSGPHGRRYCTACARRAHSAAIAGGNWGFMLLLPTAKVMGINQPSKEWM